jgi:hypothetical protein
MRVISTLALSAFLLHHAFVLPTPTARRCEITIGLLLDDCWMTPLTIDSSERSLKRATQYVVNVVLLSATNFDFKAKEERTEYMAKLKNWFQGT